MRIAVIGGGTAGFVAAITLKNSLANTKVDVIRSERIGTIGVGEGSTEHWGVWMDHVGITNGEMIKECGATFKSGIMFKDWSKWDYLQSVEGYMVQEHLQMPFMYAKLIAEGQPPEMMVSDANWNSVCPFNRLMEDNPKDALFSQYHFNTQELTGFLTRKAMSMGIGVKDDEIVEVVVDDDGIKSLHGIKETYDYDFYIDCTGFARLLINKLGAKWNSYKKYLRMNSAIVFPTPDPEKYPTWTEAKALDAGWMFRIPVQGRMGNGYIFDDTYIDEDTAKLEAEKYIGQEVEVKKKITFEPGHVDRAWIKNCVAIGLSGSFVEPLEASSIGTSIQQSMLLAKRLVNYNEATIRKYNKEFNAIMDNIRDFICLHYITDKANTPFWKDLKDMPVPDSLQENLEMWKTRLPIGEDFETETSKVLFNEYNYTIVMHGNNLLDKDSVRSQYDSIHTNAKIYANSNIERRNETTNTKCIPHKMTIDLIKRLA